MRKSINPILGKSRGNSSLAVPPTSSALMSFHWLFLGGLLSSRAHLRLANAGDCDRQPKLEQDGERSCTGSSRGAHGKETPRRCYAVGPRTEPALVVGGSSRRIKTMRFQPAYIRLIHRRNSYLDCFSRSFARAPASQVTAAEKRKTEAQSARLTGRSISATLHPLIVFPSAFILAICGRKDFAVGFAFSAVPCSL